MKLYCNSVALLFAALLLSGCGERTEAASPDCTALATRKLSEAEQIKLGEKCPRAGPPFKPSSERRW